jgi:hypothetical protein
MANRRPNPKPSSALQDPLPGLLGVPPLSMVLVGAERPDEVETAPGGALQPGGPIGPHDTLAERIDKENTVRRIIEHLRKES